MSFLTGCIIQSAANFDLKIACITCLESLMMIFVRFLLSASWIIIRVTEVSPTFGFVLLMKSVRIKIGLPLSDLHNDAVVLPLSLTDTILN